MLDLTKKDLPDGVMVGGKSFLLKTDYRIWMYFTLKYQKWVESGMQGALDIRYLFRYTLFYLPGGLRGDNGVCVSAPGCPP